MSAVAQIVLGLPLEGPFDYAVPEKWRARVAVGQRVLVLFNHRRSIGYITALKDKSAIAKLNSLLDILDATPILGDPQWAFCRAFSDLCGCSLGEAIETFLPGILRRPVPTTNIVAPQVIAPHAPGKSTLIHDLTPEGEEGWSEILRRIKVCLQNKKSVLWIFPEKVRVKEAVQRLGSSLPVIVYEHHKMIKEALKVWESIYQGEAAVIIGTRSAIFAPTPYLGLIIMMEEENRAYKQEQSPHYMVHDVAKTRQKLEGSDVIFVSAAPSAETWYEAKSKKWEHLTFTPKSFASARLIDLTNFNPKKSSLLSVPLQSEIEKMLLQKKKVLLYFNKRSHLTQKKNARGAGNEWMTMGVERFITTVGKFFPQSRLSLFHKETGRFDKTADIVVATQAIFRESLKNVFDLIAVVNVDTELTHMDFRCAQRTFALLAHLRLVAKEKMLVQTRLKENYTLKTFLKMDFAAFYRQELKIRRQLHFPPYKHLVVVMLRGKKEETVKRQSEELFTELKVFCKKGVECMEPQPDMLPIVRDKYRYAIILKGSSVGRILKNIKKPVALFRRKSRTIITLDFNP